MRRKRIKPDHRVDFRLPPGERDLIIARTFIDAELEERLQAAQAGARSATRCSPDAQRCGRSRRAMSQLKRIIVKSHGCGERSEDVYDRLAHIEARFTDEEGVGRQ